MKCPACGGDNPSTSNFCGLCGQRLEKSDINKTAAFELGDLPFRQNAAGGASSTPAPGGADPRAGLPSLGGPVLSPLSDAPAAPAAVAEPVSASADAGPTTVQPVIVARTPEPEANSDTVASPAVSEPAPAEPVLAETAVALNEVHPEPKAEPEPTPTPEPQAAEPAPEPKAAEPEPEPVKQPTPAPKAAEPKPEPAAEPAAEADKAGDGDGRNFRETKWFMEALDQEALSEVELHGIDTHEKRYDDDGSALDPSYSLRTGNQNILRKSQALRAQEEIAQFENEGQRGGVPYIALAVVAIGALGAAAWFLFLR